VLHLVAIIAESLSVSQMPSTADIVEVLGYDGCCFYCLLHITFILEKHFD